MFTNVASTLHVFFNAASARIAWIDRDPYPSRVVEVINSIRRDADGEEQVPRSDAEKGVVRVFIAPQAGADPFAIEAAVRQRMATIAGDPAWQNSDTVKTLALEHLMSARRFGFAEFFEPLWAIDNLRTSLLQGAGAGLGFFIRDVLPLVNALRANDRFAATAIVKASSPLLTLPRFHVQQEV
ncbi:hypothetical protein [Burkholderia sp. LMG 32019]|uniref:hypothetical protein n=1 Tax=Burkholderia sp. LMG 32019 TaxID=3158173 RepID=UPI003C2F64DE